MSTKILVVDDEPDIALLYTCRLKEQIQTGSFEFTFKCTTEDVLLFLENNPDYDIVISDINVNGSSGLQLISDIKDQFPLMRCIVVSAYCDIQTLRSAMCGGAHDFVLKPTDFKDLLATIDKTAEFVRDLKRNRENQKKLTALTDELDVSAKLQRSILPGNDLCNERIELFADTTPAAEVGGDFYDFFWLNDDLLGIVIADVSGKNISAAMFMTMVRTLLKTFSRHTNSPAECFKRVNESLIQENVTTMFVTALYGVIDFKEGNLIYSNAGHLPIAVVGPNKDTVYLPCDSGIALGIDDSIEFEDNVYTFERGDILMLYTDGVTEACDIHSEEYETARLSAVMDNSRDQSPYEMTQSLLKSIRAFTKGASQSDDITTLCFRLLDTMQEKVSAKNEVEQTVEEKTTKASEEMFVNDVSADITKGNGASLSQKANQEESDLGHQDDNVEQCDSVEGEQHQEFLNKLRSLIDDYLICNDTTSVCKLHGDIAQISVLCDFGEEFCFKHSKEDCIPDLLFIMDELVTNVINYGLVNVRGSYVYCALTIVGDNICIQIVDNAVRFNPLTRAAPDVASDLEQRQIGGLGIFLVRGMSERMEYAYARDHNILNIYLNSHR